MTVTADDERTLLGAAPPHDIEAEQAVLGAMMLSEAVADELSEQVDDSDFYRPKHAEIFRTIVDQLGCGEPVDALTIAHALGDRLPPIRGAPPPPPPTPTPSPPPSGPGSPRSAARRTCTPASHAPPPRRTAGGTRGSSPISPGGAG